RLSFLTVIGMIGEGPSHDQQTALIHGHLRIVILLEASIRRVFHDARLRIGEVVLVTISGSWHRRGWRTATRTSARGALPLRALRQLGLIVRLLGCRTFLGAGFQYGLGLRQSRQPVLAPRHLVAHHQPIGNLWLLALFTEGKASNKLTR